MFMNYHYTIEARGYDGLNPVRNPSLYYNSDHRLVKDSGLNNMPTSYFNYFGNIIAYSTWLTMQTQLRLVTEIVSELDDQGMLAFNYQIYKNGANWDTYMIPYMNNENLRNPFYIKNLSGAWGFYSLHGI